MSEAPDLLEFRWTPKELALRDALRHRLNISKAVLAARAHHGWTQRDLARLARTTQFRISRLEAMKGNVRFSTLERIANACGLTISLAAASRSTGEEKT